MGLLMKLIGARYVGFFFVLMLIFPTVLQEYRLGLLIVLLLGFIANLSYDRTWKMHRDVLILFLIALLLGIVYVIYGLVSGGEGASSLATVFVVWPCLYLLLIGKVQSISSLKIIYCSLIHGIFLANLICFAFIVSGFTDALSSLQPLFNMLGGVINLYDGSMTKFNMSTLTTIIYAFPFLITHFFYANNNFEVLISKRYLITQLILSSIILIFSGRSGFWVVAIVSVPISIGLLYCTNAVNLKLKQICVNFFYLFILFWLLYSILQMFGIDFSKILNGFIYSFNFNDINNYSANRRQEQFFNLISAWSEKPLFGAGLGVVPPNESTWEFELQYVALLWFFGVFGFTVYFLMITYIIFQSIYLCRKNRDLTQYLMP